MGLPRRETILKGFLGGLLAATVSAGAFVYQTKQSRDQQRAEQLQEVHERAIEFVGAFETVVGELEQSRSDGTGPELASIEARSQLRDAYTRVAFACNGLYDADPVEFLDNAYVTYSLLVIPALPNITAEDALDRMDEDLRVNTSNLFLYLNRETAKAKDIWP